MLYSETARISDNIVDLVVVGVGGIHRTVASLPLYIWRDGGMK